MFTLRLRPGSIVLATISSAASRLDAGPARRTDRAVSDPSPTTAYDVLMFVRDWFGPSVGAGALLFTWRVSKGWTEMQKDHTALKEDHDDTKRRVSAQEE